MTPQDERDMLAARGLELLTDIKINKNGNLTARFALGNETREFSMLSKVILPREGLKIKS